MKKMNNKGYVLIEIILAFAIAFTIIYFMMDIIVKMKNKNDDLVYESIVKTEQSIVINKLMKYAMTEKEDFDCEDLKNGISNNMIKYKDDVLTVVDEVAKVSNSEDDGFYCKNNTYNGKISVRIPIEIMQNKDKNFDIKIDYDYNLGFFIIRSYRCANVSVGSAPWDLDYTGDCEVEGLNNINWKVKFLTSGELFLSGNAAIDIFLVGGGGGGRGGVYAGGGGGGYTSTISNYIVKRNINSDGYSIVVGEGGESNEDGKPSSGFGYEVFGGEQGKAYGGGNGGSGGGAIGKNGGSNGMIGEGDTSSGKGQGRTTCEFNEGIFGGTCDEGVQMYAGGGAGNGGTGGGAGGGGVPGGNGTDKLGGGGGGGRHVGGTGGDGIVIIRNSRIEHEINFEYTGLYEYIDDGNGNWRIKFLSDGEFKTSEDIDIDIFLVGGGGGGEKGYNAAGGGGGYTATISNYRVNSNEGYYIYPGKGGDTEMNGENTTGFGYSVDGGERGKAYGGGNGGSGGGAIGKKGGSNGMVGNGIGGKGQGRTTCEFNEGTFGGTCNEGVQMYAGGGSGQDAGAASAGGGGSGGFSNVCGGGGALDSFGGGGGGGKYVGGSGGDGIVIIRNARIEHEIDFEYTGLYEYIDDGNGDWRIKFLSDGYFKTTENIDIDIFLVGGGGGGGISYNAAGGGGGYTATISNYEVYPSEEGYFIDVGGGGDTEMNGENTTGFGYSVAGGTGGKTYGGGDGGSGGGGYSASAGSNGSYGGGSGGKGQGRTTCEFNEGIFGETCNSGVQMYAGGGAGSSDFAGGDGGGGRGGGGGALDSFGGGGGGGMDVGGSGGDGIVIIRNSRIEHEIDFEYTGLYEYIDDGDGNWRIKFLSDGEFKTSEDIDIDIFLVGGGGGGDEGYYATGGGGGCTATIFNYEVIPNKDYKIIVGKGGDTEKDGDTTSGFDEEVKGGIGGHQKVGGSGGSGGGSSNGGANGSNGSGDGGGTGQGRTTCEFNEGTFGGTCNSGVQMYAGGGAGSGDFAGSLGGGGRGGGGGALDSFGGGGGGGMYVGGTGGDGIVIIRNKR